jgi:hypothetical protein
MTVIPDPEILKYQNNIPADCLFKKAAPTVKVRAAFNYLSFKKKIQIKFTGN